MHYPTLTRTVLLGIIGSSLVALAIMLVQQMAPPPIVAPPSEPARTPPPDERQLERQKHIRLLQRHISTCWDLGMALDYAEQAARCWQLVDIERRELNTPLPN